MTTYQTHQLPLIPLLSSDTTSPVHHRQITLRPRIGRRFESNDVVSGVASSTSKPEVNEILGTLVTVSESITDASYGSPPPTGTLSTVTSPPPTPGQPHFLRMRDSSNFLPIHGYETPKDRQSKADSQEPIKLHPHIQLPRLNDTINDLSSSEPSHSTMDTKNSKTSLPQPGYIAASTKPPVIIWRLAHEKSSVTLGPQAAAGSKVFATRQKRTGIIARCA